MTYEFQNTAHNTKSAMLDGIAYEWWTGGGNNDPETVDDLLTDYTAAEAAAEAIDGWDLDKSDDDAPSHMELNGYTAADLADAMQRFIDARPDKET